MSNNQDRQLHRLYLYRRKFQNCGVVHLSRDWSKSDSSNWFCKRNCYWCRDLPSLPCSINKVLRWYYENSVWECMARVKALKVEKVIETDYIKNYQNYQNWHYFEATKSKCWLFFNFKQTILTKQKLLSYIK